MSEDERYFRWLIRKIDDGRAKRYSKMLGQLFDKEYRWILPLDENDAVNGLTLRSEFELGYSRDMGCSVLEMLVKLSTDFEFKVAALPGDEDYTRWFWDAIESLNLDIYDDNNYDFNGVDAELEAWLTGEILLFERKIDMSKLKVRTNWYQLNRLLGDKNSR